MHDSIASELVKGKSSFFGINCPEGFFVHVCNGCFAMMIVQDSRFALESSGCLSGGHTLVGMVVVPRQPNDVIVYPKWTVVFPLISQHSRKPVTLTAGGVLFSLVRSFSFVPLLLGFTRTLFLVRARPWAEWKN